MAKTVLVTGASGLLGRQVQRTFDIDGWRAVGTGLSRAKPPSIVRLDLRDRGAVERVLDDVKPDAVVHCVADRSPDSCTARPDAAMRLNAMVAGELAAATAARGVFLVYISTDYVFAGRRGEAPYATTATPAPTNVYGQTKLAGEKAVLEASSRAAAASAGSPAVRSVVLRVPVLYGTGEVEESAVNTLVAQVWAAQKVTDPTKKIPVDAYAQRFPTNTSDVARVCRDVCTRYLANADEALPTVLHFSSEDRMTKWDMVRTFGEMLALPTDNLEPHVPAQGDDTSATATSRPYDTHLDTSVLQHLGIAVHTADFRAWWRRELGAFRH